MSVLAADRALIERIERGLRMVTVPFPHLSGLVAATRVTIDDRLPTIGVFGSGRLSANPQFIHDLNDTELVFVLAHEMLHLALRTHDRAKGADLLEFNFAHDYIINDILRTELGAPIPANGLDMPGARKRSAEEIVLELRRNKPPQAKTGVWRVGRGAEGGGSAERREGAEGADGARRAERVGAGDVLDAETEAELYPEEAEEAARRAEQVRELAAKALGLARAMGLAKGLRGIDAGGQSQMVVALRGLYRPPWELALQRWIESVAPGDRTFSRASRRGAERTDVVLPGRRRESWILNVVLDTSGSMTDEIPRALGTLAEFCDAVSVDQVRLVQCDTAITSDVLLGPHELVERRIEGYGGSDLSPALRYLAEDQHVRAVVVITDGEVSYPPEPMPYDLLWLVPERFTRAFNPPYGRVVVMERR
jgi:predicted metal-dependent peptidase